MRTLQEVRVNPKHLRMRRLLLIEMKDASISRIVKTIDIALIMGIVKYAFVCRIAVMRARKRAEMRVKVRRRMILDKVIWSSVSLRRRLQEKCSVSEHYQVF
jgi:hypothetical protein